MEPHHLQHGMNTVSWVFALQALLGTELPLQALGSGRYRDRGHRGPQSLHLLSACISDLLPIFSFYI